MSAACVCGRRFAKPFGLRVHQRSCMEARGLAPASEACPKTGRSASACTSPGHEDCPDLNSTQAAS